jgi:hypothetical protein
MREHGRHGTDEVSSRVSTINKMTTVVGRS